jgi:hypothetical protein
MWDKMGNQIKFSSKDRDKPSTGDDNQYHALEIENIQLKNTNRKLITKLDHQKQLIKNLNLEIESLKNINQSNDLNKLKEGFQGLKKKNDDLEKLLTQSRKEISNLKNEIKKSTQQDGSDSKKSSTWGKLKKLRN